jgi:hypothetical protein
MRNFVLATVLAIGLATSGIALAAVDGVHGGANSGATVSSGAFAASSGNGYASTVTGGYQSTVAGFRGTSSSSYSRRQGDVSVEGVAGAYGGAYSETQTRGSGIAGSGTRGSSYATTGGAGYFDTHGSNPEGWAIGGAGAENSNKAATFSYGRGGARAWSESGTTATFSASAWGNRDGGGHHPVEDTVETGASASSESYRGRGVRSYGNGEGVARASTSGWSFGAAHAESGNVYSNDDD